MREIVHTLAIVFTGLVVVTSVAHALELPGKMRLKEDVYRAVQTIYYPGFTIAGAAEPLAMVATLLLLFLMPAASRDFWLTLGAWLGLIGLHAVYWLVTHPVNRVWLEGEKLSSAGGSFFGVGAVGGAANWIELRDRWEYSHVGRALLAVLSLIALVIAAS